jgi:hypothetical protein
MGGGCTGRPSSWQGRSMNLGVEVLRVEALESTFQGPKSELPLGLGRPVLTFHELGFCAFVGIGSACIRFEWHQSEFSVRVG